MANEFEVVGTPTSPQEESALDPLKVASQAYGPRRVKTPNMEIEQFSPVEVQKALDRQNAVSPTISDFAMDIASPNHHAYRPIRRRCDPECGY